MRRQQLPIFYGLSHSVKLTAPKGERQHVTACDMCVESKIDKGVLSFIIMTKTE